MTEFRPDPKLEQALDGWIARHRDEYVADVIEAIAIPSVAEPQEGPYPYGKPCADMLDHLGRKARAWGFDFENHEYYMASAPIPGAGGGREIGLFGHADVVGENGVWTYGAYKGVEKDGYIIGRGSNDNKGPTLAVCYAMRFLREAGITLQNNVRLMFGSHEEGGMSDIEYYMKRYPLPDITIVPDSWWGADVAEMGGVNLTLSVDLSESNLAGFWAGEGSSVPGSAWALLSGVTLGEARSKLEGKKGISLGMEGPLVRVEAEGIGKHAAFPEGSLSALWLLAKALDGSGLVQGDGGVLAFLSRTLSDYNGHAVGFHFADDFYGQSIHTCTKARLEGDRLSLSFMARYPACCDGEEMTGKILSYFERSGYGLEVERTFGPFRVDPRHPVVEILCAAASYVAGEELGPFAQKGGTYARVMPGAFPAGATIRTREQTLFPEGRGGAHQPDECAEIEVLLMGIKAYVLALIELDRLLGSERWRNMEQDAL